MTLKTSNKEKLEETKQQSVNSTDVNLIIRFPILAFTQLQRDAKEVTLPTCTENRIFVPKFWAMIGSINKAPSSKV